MELRQAIYGRRAVREYRDGPLDQAVIARLIDAAIQAPSAMNEQPWLFAVVRAQHTLDELSRQSKLHMRTRHGELTRSGHFESLNDPDFHIFYHAPALIIIAATAELPWAAEDCALAAQNLMLAAYGEGLGSCWIGFAQEYLNTAAGKALVGLPADCVPVAPIIVGAARTVPPPVARQRPEIRWID